MNLRIALAVALSGLLVPHQSAQAQIPRVPQQVQELMQNRQYEAAIAAMDATADSDQVDSDYLAYLRGQAFHLQKKYDEAIAAFRVMGQKYPDSPYARRARFATALSHTRQGDFRTAEKIYREEARYLLSLDRKQELADIYLEFAKAFFTPPNEQTQPDYQKALEFYRQALELGPQPAQRREVELLIGQCLQKLGQLDEAIAHFDRFVAEHLDEPLVVEARFRLGETQLQKQDAVAARRTWQDLLELHADDPSPRIAEAWFNLSLTYGIPSPADGENLSLGVAALQRFLAKFPDHKLASAAHLRIAQTYQHAGRFEDSVENLVPFLQDVRYADRPEIPDGRVLLGNAYKMQRKFDDALHVWQEYLQKHPTHQLWSTVQQEIVDAEYLKALNLYSEKKFDAARALWSEFLTKYPLDRRSRSILFLFGQMHFDAENWDAAIEDWRRLVSKYPQSEEASRAQFMIASTLEEHLKKLDRALEEYRKVTWGSSENAAQQRIARLTARSLRAVTERVFRSDETPRLRLETRNIPSVTVRVYQVDLETYFRKMHLASGVEQLDIALIDPDHAFEFEIPEYVPYQQFTQGVEIPLPSAQTGGAKAGVMAVTVSSKTLEATTLIVRSDLDVIIKSSRDEVFLFAQNMRDGKPWPQARVLVSDGSQVFAEGSTDDQGVYRHTYEQLKSADDVRVFAVIDNHIASNNVGLAGVGVAQGLTDKGYIFTDRPAYRPGQMVHVRGILRQAKQDVFTIATGKTYQLTVFDNRNRLVNESEVSLNDFGSFHANFLLPAGCPQGEYRISVQDNNKENYQGSFVVHDYQLEPVRIEVNAPRTVYYRGEEISGTIKVAYYYGAPLADREVRYELAGGRSYTAKTDREGQIEFSLPTRDYREAQPLPLVVTLPERNLQTGKTFYLATQAFTLSAKTARAVFLAGETFELNLNATDAEGEPIAVPLELRVLQRTTVAGRTGEVSVQEHSLATDDKGLARHTLKLAEGGEYLLRVEGIDRFGNPVSTQHPVTISDDKDAVRLRILASQHTYRVGDTASVQVHWREQPALALITYQGARILEYQLVNLTTGTNKLDVPIAADLAPNFDLAIAVMTDVRDRQRDDLPARRFHEASSPFTVQRELHVALDWEGKAQANARRRPATKSRSR